MAEAWWRRLGGADWEVESAGSKPAGYVHPGAIAAMAEQGVDLADHKSKAIGDLKSREFDLVITVCDGARDSCPALPGARQTLHWPFDDPFRAVGTEAEKANEFRRVRDEIRQRIADYLARESGGSGDGAPVSSP